MTDLQLIPFLWLGLLDVNSSLCYLEPHQRTNKQNDSWVQASLPPESTRPCLPLNPSIGEPKKEYPIFQPLKGVGFFLS